jgi:hypothetical protein
MYIPTGLNHSLYGEALKYGNGMKCSRLCLDKR